MAIDPITQAARAILNALRAAPGFTAMVNPGNLVDMTSEAFERFKTQTQAGDLPEVVLLQDDFRVRPFGSSSQVADIHQCWQLICTHDSLRVQPVNQLKYQTLIALLAAGPSLGLDGLVRAWEITTGHDDSTGPKPWTRGTLRWVSIMTVKVEMYLTRQSLLARD